MWLHIYALTDTYQWDKICGQLQTIEYCCDDSINSFDLSYKILNYFNI